MPYAFTALCPNPYEDHINVPYGAQSCQFQALLVWKAGISEAFLSHWASPDGAFPPSGKLEQLTAAGRCKTVLEKTWNRPHFCKRVLQRTLPCSPPQPLSLARRRKGRCNARSQKAAVKGRQRAWAGCSQFPSGHWWVMKCFKEQL